MHLDELRTVRHVAQDLCNLRILTGGSRAHEGSCWQALLRLCNPSHRAEPMEFAGNLVLVLVQRLLFEQSMLARLGIDSSSWEIWRRAAPYMAAVEEQQVRDRPARCMTPISWDCAAEMASAQHVDERIPLPCRYKYTSEVQPRTSQPWLQTIPGPQLQCLLHHTCLWES